MLLNLTASNYKSFRDPFVFSMEAAPRQRELAYSLLQEKIGRRNYKAISVGIIYGPNASGKTNILSAADTLRSIVLRGNIRNPEEPRENPNRAISELELIPNKDSDGSIPTRFGIAFIDQGFRIGYELEIDLGKFLDKGHTRRILYEKLNVNDYALYARTQQEIDWADYASLPKTLKRHTDKNAMRSTTREALPLIVKPDELLLSTAGSVLGSYFPDLVRDWFREKLIVICAGQRLNALVPPSEHFSAADEAFAVPQDAKEAARRLGMSSEAMGFGIQDGPIDGGLYSAVKAEGGGVHVIRAEDFESSGTLRFVHAFLAAKTALRKGATLMMDEFDASIHPAAMQALIRAFHNDEVNTEKAQLIFSTHNPMYMNKYLCRRDELKFVEKKTTGAGSEHWSLADFGTSGREGVRSVDDYLQDYKKGCYGAIDYLAFEDILSPRRNEAGESSDDKESAG